MRRAQLSSWTLYIERLGVLSEGLSSMQSGKGMQEFAKKAESLSKAFGGMQAKMGNALKPMESQAQKTSKSLEKIFDDYKDLGKGLTFAGSAATLQKQLDSYANLLEKAKLREAELGAAGTTGGKMYEYAIRDILKYSNVIEGLREQLKSISAESSVQKMDFTITGLEESRLSLEELENDLKEMQALISEGYKGGILENLQIGLEETETRFPEATQTIRGYREAIAAVGSMSESSAKKIKNVADSLRDIEAPRIDAAGGGDEFTAGMADKIKGFVKQAQIAAGTRVYTEDYKRIRADIDRAEESLEKFNQKKRDMEASGVGHESKEWEKITAQIAAAERQLGAYQDKKNLMEYTGEDIETPAFDLSGLNKSSSMIKKLGSATLGATRKIAQFGKSMLDSGKSSKKMDVSLAGGFKTILKYGLGIRSVYVLIGKFRSAVKEGFGNLAQYSGETNASLSTLMSSLTQLKNSFAVAFAPILNFVTPALNALIQTVTKAMNTVGQFFSALTGKSYAVQAIKVNQDYAASLSKSGDSAKDTESKVEDLGKALSVLGFDELNQLSAKVEVPEVESKAKGFSDEILPEDMFVNAPISKGIKEFADKVKGVLGGVFDTFRQAWDSKGAAVMASAKAALGSLKASALSVGKTFYEVFTGDVGLAWAKSLLELFRSIFDVIESISTAFNNAWNNGAGLELVTSFFTMFTNINGLLTAIGDSFARVFSNGTGVEIWTNILGIATGVFDTIGNIAAGITEAWNAAGLGDSIIQGVLNIFNTVLETIHSIADSTAEWAGKLDFTPLLQSIDTLLKAIEPLTQNIGDGLKWFWDNVLLPIGSWTLQEAVPTFLNMVSAGIEALNKVVEALKPLGQWLWDSFLKPLGEWTGDLIIGSMEKITGLLEKFGDWVTNHQEAVQNMAIIVGSFFAAWKITTTIAGIANFVSKIGGLIGIVSKMSGLIGTVFNPWTLGIGAVIAAGVLLWKNWDTIKEKAGQLKDWVVGKTTALKDGAVKSFTTLKDNIGDAMGAVQSSVKTGWSGAKTKFSNFDTWMSNVFQHDWTENFGLFWKCYKWICCNYFE